jgi:endonuclease G
MKIMRMAACGVVLALGLASGAVAQAACPSSYLDGTAPAFATPPVGPAEELCFTYFAVLHSDDTLTPLWSAEHLTKAEAVGGDNIGRKNAFHPETKLAKGKRAEKADYLGFQGVYDRGHMTPSDDMPTMPSQRQTFTLANMVPQASVMNQTTWQYIEASLHVLAETDGELFIVTGPIFGAHPQRLHNKVAVPDYTFKAVYDAKTKTTTAFVATNVNQPVCWVISVAALTEMTGLDPFPSLPASAKADATPWDLPHGTKDRPLPDCKPK